MANKNVRPTASQEAFRGSNDLLARLGLYHARRGDRKKAVQIEGFWRENKANWEKLWGSK